MIPLDPDKVYAAYESIPVAAAKWVPVEVAIHVEQAGTPWPVSGDATAKLRGKR